MTHFVNDDGFNTFRLPVGWQYLTNNIESGTINETNFDIYNTFVNASCSTLGCNLLFTEAPVM